LPGVRQVADDVWQVPLAPRDGVNTYVLGDVLVDAGTDGMGKKLPGRLEGRKIAAHTITHAHRDHVGGSSAVVEALGVPFWCPAGDAADAEAGQSVVADTFMKPLLSRAGFPPVKVDRKLEEGDTVGPGFVVVDAPGHSPGQVAFWRESDRVLVLGDVWFNLSLKTFRSGLRDPPRIFTVDPERNRESMRKLAALEPEIACFGHGPVIRGAAAKLRAFLDRA
jgi:hydroxyacylglutathione hydrolase